jgi:hypothetical protein
MAAGPIGAPALRGHEGTLRTLSQPETPRLCQLFLPSVVDQQPIRAQPGSRRALVHRQLAVVHEVADRDPAGQLSEVGDEPPVAAPPGALTAHHRDALGSGPGEDLVDGGEEARPPHVARISPECFFPPRHISRTGLRPPEAAQPFLPPVGDAVTGKPPLQLSPGKMRVAAAAGCRADVDQGRHLCGAQQFGDALGAGRPVPEREQRRRPMPGRCWRVHGRETARPGRVIGPA